MNKFKAGNVVQLKSGGPEMTVTRINVNNPKEIDCKWFRGLEVCSGIFSEEEVELIRQ